MDGQFSPLGLGSNWSVSNGALQYNGDGHTQVYAGDSGWTNYNLNVAVKLATLNDYPGGIRGRIDPTTGAGYAVWLYPVEGVIKLFRNTGGTLTPVWCNWDKEALRFDTTGFHNVQLSFNGSQIQVLMTGQCYQRYRRHLRFGRDRTRCVKSGDQLHQCDGDRFDGEPGFVDSDARHP